MKASLKKSFADVTRRKGRTLMVVLGIFIGVLGLTGINVTQQTIFSSYSYSIGSAADHPDIQLQINQFDPALDTTLAAQPNVQTVQMQEELDTQWHVSAAPGYVPIAIVSYPDLQHIAIAPFQLTSGHYPGPGEIVLEYGDQDLQAVSIGDMVTVDTSQNTTTTLRVAGFVRTEGLGLQGPVASGIAQGYMSSAPFQQAFGSIATAPRNNVVQLQYSVAIKVRNTSQASTTATTLAHVLQANHVTVLDIRVATPFNQAGITAVNGLFTLLRLLAILALVLSGLLILNTIITLITEQTQIIGTLKAVGGTRSAILRGYLVSVLIYSVLGTLLGIALGVWLGYSLGSALARAISLDVGPFAVEPWIILLSLAVGFGVPLLSALLPLWIGTSITVREAFSAYGISAGQGNDFLARVARRLTWVSQTTWLGLRGIFRKRWRAALTLLTLTLAGITFLTVQTASASTNQTIAHAFDSYHYNVEGGSRGDIASVVAQVEALPNVQRVELAGELDAVTTTWGQVHLFGFQTNTQLYRPPIVSGRWLSSSDSNAILINEEMASATGLKVGDPLDLAVGSGYSTWTIVGIVHQRMEDVGQIGDVFTSMENFDRIDGDPSGYASELLVQARNTSPGAIDQLTRQIGQLGGASGGYPIRAIPLQETIRERQQSQLVFYALLYGVALIVGAVSILGLANALAASVLERRREIGLLRSMGGSAFRVARVFWVEGLALGGIAWVLGALLGIPLAYGFVQLISRLIRRVDFALDASAFVVMLVAVLIIATLASIIPALRASRVRIAEMLRYE